MRFGVRIEYRHCLTSDFQFEFLPMNLRALAFIRICAGSNAMKPLWRSTTPRVGRWRGSMTSEAATPCA
jgi:hypothetical protein